MTYKDKYRLELDSIISGYDRETCWVQARAGTIPTKPGCVVMTMQKLQLSGSDIFFALNEMRTDDGGETWDGPREHAQTLGRVKEPGGIEAVPCDFNPKWHAKTGKLLGTGHVARYIGDELMPNPRPRDVSYSVYDEKDRSWTKWDTLKMPDEDVFFSCGAGSAQRWDCPDGTILLPVYTHSAETTNSRTTIVRCKFNGEKLSYIDHGNFLDCRDPRGMGEPSIIHFQGRYYLTIRNDVRGYVAMSEDGMNWKKPKPWCFDHGPELGNYNTQQHWLVGPETLYLIYTRRAGWNDHVFRHRAPLFMAEVETNSLTIKRNTERIIVPERGARLGNFQVTQINEKESWVIAAEWMQNDEKGFRVEGSKYCERFGSDNTIWAAKVLFD